METTELLIKELSKLAPEVAWQSKQVLVSNPGGKKKAEEIEIYGQEKDKVIVGPYVVRAEIFMLVGVVAVARFVHQEYQGARHNSPSHSPGKVRIMQRDEPLKSKITQEKKRKK